jgi:Spy/CpxP family protein refolding chaperone
MNRRTVVGLVAAGTVGLVATAGAAAFGAGRGPGHGGFRPAIMRRMVTAEIDEVLDRAQVTSEQRARIYAARDRVFATMDAERAQRGPHMEEALRLFEADQPDRAALEALHTDAEAARARVREAVHDAIVEVHGVLTPTQRRVVTDYVRAHRPEHRH